VDVTSTTTRNCNPCARLGWNIGSGSRRICGKTLLGRSSCSGPVAASVAANYCAGLFGDSGARLCTSAELLAGETRLTGCNYDDKLVWSSTACPGGFLQVYGDPSAFGNSKWGITLSKSNVSSVWISFCFSS
jgi:hypothetical protein